MLCPTSNRRFVPISDTTPVYSITLSGIEANVEEPLGRMSWRFCLEGLACRKSVPFWRHRTLVHLQRAEEPMMKAIFGSPLSQARDIA
jgi:hypothetical protein